MSITYFYPTIPSVLSLLKKKIPLFRILIILRSIIASFRISPKWLPFVSKGKISGVNISRKFLMNTTLIPWINERIKIMENFFALWIYSSVLDRGEGEGKSIRRLNLTIENVARSRRKRSTKSTTRFSLLVRFANWELNSFVRRWNVCTRRRGRGRDRREKLCVNARDEGSGAASWKLEEAFTFRLRKKK